MIILSIEIEKDNSLQKKKRETKDVPVLTFGRNYSFCRYSHIAPTVFLAASLQNFSIVNTLVFVKVIGDCPDDSVRSFECVANITDCRTLHFTDKSTECIGNSFAFFTVGNEYVAACDNALLNLGVGECPARLRELFNYCFCRSQKRSLYRQETKPRPVCRREQLCSYRAERILLQQQYLRLIQEGRVNRPHRC